MKTSPQDTDWLSQEFLADPYPHYAAMRKSDPVHFDESRGSWLLFRYADVEPALRDNERFSAEQQLGGSMLVTDPPDHTRLRTLVSKAFTARTVSALAPRIQGLVDDLLDAAAARGEMDAIADFAYPLPITVIAEMLGVEPERRDFFRSASQKIAVAMGPITDAQTAFRAIEGRNELLAYFEELIPKRKVDPRDDVLSALVRAEDRGDFLTHGELLAMLLLLLVGGHETTVNLIANGMLALLRNPDQLELLRAEEGIEKRAVEELLRYDAPVQYSGRVAKHDIETGGKHIKAGEGVRMIIGSANRDPEAFADPDRLDLTRDAHEHVAFGAGVHFCLGAQLARLEGQVALSKAVRRFPNLRLASNELRWRPAPVLRGLEALPVTLN
jgi:pimeloyl-[acyl-carrier protein] synthase